MIFKVSSILKIFFFYKNNTIIFITKSKYYVGKKQGLKSAMNAIKI